VLNHRESVSNIAFSIDGVTREEHDFWRGEGSFVRLVRAFSRCFGSEIPFNFKVALRRDTVAKLEPLALFAARMGAANLRFAHLLPNSEDFAGAEMLSPEERQRAEQEIANLSRIFKMPIAIDVGYYNIDVGAPCSPLAGVSANIDYRGCLTLCCNLSGFRGATGQGDVVGDLNTEDFAAAYERLSSVADAQRKVRAKRLTTLAAQGITPDLVTGSPCLFCLDSFGKLPPKSSIAGINQRSLPVLDAFNSGSSTVIN
jgi:MoaA/NifB/PqqE/SkfB family radical SAM enzyme